MGVFAGATALGLLTGCPATPPSDPRSSDQVDVTAVDRASVIPPFGPDATRADFVQGDFYWSRERPPGTPLGPVDVAGLRWLIETELPDRLFPRVDMSLATTLGGPAEAREAADEIRARMSGHLTRYDVREAVAVLGQRIANGADDLCQCLCRNAARQGFVGLVLSALAECGFCFGAEGYGGRWLLRLRQSSRGNT